MDTTLVTHEFFEQVRLDHERLLGALAEAERLVLRPDMTASQAGEVFASLQEAAATHFRDEEESGCFEQVVADAPHLAGRAQALRAEHASLLAAAGALAAQAQSGDGSPQWQGRLASAFNSFHTALLSHEAAENVLLEDAYNQDMGFVD